MKRVLKPGILLMAVAGLAACGGGGGNNDETGNNNVALPVVSTVLDGVALDGYLRNAKACLDLNDNLVCEAGEPATVTDSAGRYRLTAPSLDAANAHRVVVEVIAGQSTDADAPSTPIPNSYVLVAPVGRHGVISPITTLAYQLQADQPGLSLDEAAAQLRAGFALPGDLNLWADYDVANASADQQALHNLARVVARASGEGLAGVKTALGGTMAGADKRAALLLIWKQLLDRSNSIVEAVAQGKSASEITIEFDYHNVHQQLMAAVLPKSAVTDAIGLMAGGLSIPFFVPQDLGVIPALGQFMVTEAVTGAGGYVDTKWTKSLFDDKVQDFQLLDQSYEMVVLKAGRWTEVRSSEICRNFSGGLGLHVSCPNGYEEEYRFHAVDVAGQSMDAVLRYGVTSGVADAWRVDPAQVFSPAALAYQLSGQTTADLYVVGGRLRDALGAPYATLDAMMANYPANSSTGIRIGGGNLVVQFDAVTGNAGQLSLFELTGADQPWQALPLKGQWERKTVGEETLLLFTFPSDYLHLLPTNAYWRQGMTLYTPPGGMPAVYDLSIKLKGAPISNFFFNTAAMDDLKAARGTAVPAT